MRRILTSNREASLSIESLVDDEDLHELLTRDEFHKIIEPFTQRFQALLDQAIKAATDASNNKFL
jgi:molecular chaperone DnaK (HSP70)